MLSLDPVAQAAVREGGAAGARHLAEQPRAVPYLAFECHRNAPARPLVTFLSAQDPAAGRTQLVILLLGNLVGSIAAAAASTVLEVGPPLPALMLMALLGEAVQGLLGGELDTARIALRLYINATIGFEKLAAATGTPAKSLMRMFGPKGNPTAANLSEVIRVLRPAPTTTGICIRRGRSLR